MLRSVKTNMFYKTLFTCNVKLLQSRHSGELKIFPLSCKLGMNVPGVFHAGTPELKCFKCGWFRAGVLYWRSFGNNCGHNSPGFNHCLLLLVELLWGCLARMLLGLSHGGFQQITDLPANSIPKPLAAGGLLSVLSMLLVFLFHYKGERIQD